MRLHKNKFLTTVAAAALALAVGACSSSSDDDETAATATATPPPVTTEPAPEPTPTPELTPAEQLAAAEAAVVAAQAMVVALTNSSSADEASAAYAALGAAQAALHAATNLPANQVAALQAQINQLVLDLEAANLKPSAETVAIETAQADAATAATEAMEAATAAKVASDAAQTARENLATLQTGETSGDLAHAVYTHAKAAADAAAEAQTASDAAAEATGSVAATRALLMAETARDNAVTAQGMAETQSAAAVMAVENELQVVEKTKTVGETSITIDTVAEISIIGIVERRTGLIKDENLALNTGGLRDVYGRLVAPVDGAGAAVTVTPARDSVDPSIGVTYDSADDSARLTLITAYLGSERQMQFVRVGADANPFAAEGGEVGAPFLLTPEVANSDNGEGVGVDGAYTVALGKITIDHDGDGSAVDAAAVVDAGEVTEKAKTAPVTVAPKLAGDHFVDSASSTKLTASLYYVETGEEDETTGKTDDGIDQTKKFLERNVSNGVTTYTPVNVIQVTIDNATDFKHIHYGLWNGLSGSGANTVTELGTGFVAATPDGMGMTDPDHDADGGMPNFGDATYNGNWVANVQEADNEGDGAITRHDGTSSMVADFVKDTVTVTLSGLATLDGAISENRFSGDAQPKLANSLPGGLANADDFMGSFTGGFFGPSAAEAGGVFDYASKDNKNGAFRGAFGGDQQ